MWRRISRTHPELMFIYICISIIIAAHVPNILKIPYAVTNRFSITLGFAFSPDENYLVTAGYLNTLIIWDVRKDKYLRTLKLNPSDPKTLIQSVAFSHDSKMMAAAGTCPSPFSKEERQLDLEKRITCQKGTVGFKIWNTDTWKESNLQFYHDKTPKQVQTVAFSPDGRYLLTSGYPEINLWDLRSGMLLKSFGLPKFETVRELIFLKDRKRFVSLHIKQVRIWDLETDKVLQTFEAAPGSFFIAIAIDPSSQYLAMAGGIKAVTIWDLESNQTVQTIDGPHNPAPSGISFSQDGKILVGSYVPNIKTITFWDTQSGQPAQTLSTNTYYPLEKIYLLRNNQYLYAAGTNNQVTKWDVKKGKLAKIIKPSLGYRVRTYFERWPLIIDILRFGRVSDETITP